LSTAEAARCLGIREAALRKRLQYGREAIGAEVLANFRAESGKEQSDRLRGKVLGAIPFGTLPWRAAAVGAGVSAVAVSKALSFVLSGAVLLALAGTAVFLASSRSVKDARTAQSVPGVRHAAPLSVQDGRIDVSVRRGAGTEPLPRLTVKATPTSWDSKAWEEMLRGAGTPLRFADLLAPSFRENATKEDLKRRWAEQGLSVVEVAEAEKQLDAFWSSFTQGNLPPSTRNPLRQDTSARRVVNLEGKGTASFVNLPAGDYLVLAEGASEVGKLLGSAFAKVRGGQTAKAHIVLKEVAQVPSGSAIRGRVIDAKTGKGVAGARVEVGESADFGRSGFAQTDSEGRFDLSPFVFREGTLFGRATLGKAESKTVEFEHKKETPSEVEISLLPRGTLSGRVTDAAGQAVPGAAIMLTDIKGQVSRSVAHADDEGRYSFEHDGGVLVLFAMANTAKSERSTLELPVDESRTLDLVLPNTGRALLDVLLPDGTRPEELNVSLSWMDGGHHGSNAALKRQGDYFVLNCLVPEKYQALVMVPGFEGQLIGIEIEPLLTDVVCTLRLQAARTGARILVQDEAGKPVEKVRLSAMYQAVSAPEDGEDARAFHFFANAVETGADGLAEFKGLPAGRYDFRDDSGEALTDVDVPCPALLHMRKVSERSMRSTGVSLQYYPFNLRDGDHGGARLDLMDTAKFAITPSGRPMEDGAEVGTNTVYLVKRGYTAGVCQVSIGQDQLDWAQPRRGFTPVDVVLGEGGSVAGQVECPEGTPAAARDLVAIPIELWEAAQVAWSDDSHPDRQVWPRFGRILAQHAATEEDGSFSVRFLPPGQYVLATDTEKPGILLVSEPVTVVAGKETAGVVLRERP
jgi:protocatechuate 3,4-dioxygenase beta subunit